MRYRKNSTTNNRVKCRVNALFSNKMILLSVVLLFFLSTNNQVSGYPEQEYCYNYPQWTPGAYYGQMSVSYISSSTSYCTLSMNPSASYYTPGQSFTITVSSPTSYGIKIVTWGGSSLSGGSSGVYQEASDCLDWHSKYTSVSATWTAPAGGGEIRVRALCGDKYSMYVTNDLVLQPAPTPAPTTASPTTGIPTALPTTSSPTPPTPPVITPTPTSLAPTTAKPTTSSPTTGAPTTLSPTPPTSSPTPVPPGTTSTDPNYQWQKTLETQTILYFKVDSTFAYFKMTSTRQGWLGFGLGNSMVPGVAIIASNSVTLGLYNLNTHFGTATQVATILASSTTLVSSFGVENLAFSVANGVSVLTFQVRLAKQDSRFTVVNSNSIGVNAIWAAGSSTTFAYHANSGTISSIVFGTGSSSTVGASTTKVTSLNSQMSVVYSANSTHGFFQLQKTSNGYVSIGTGLYMVGSTCLIGMDPSSNSGYPGVGLYNLVSKVGSNSAITKAVATTSAQLYAYGITQTSFSYQNGITTMSWTVEFAKQQSSFTLIKTTGVDVCYAGGPVAYGMHNFASSQSSVTFASAVAGGGGGGYTVDMYLIGHVVLMILSWLVFIPLGVFFPLFNNPKRTSRAFCGLSGTRWFNYHWSFLAVGVLLNYVGCLLSFLSVNSRQSDHVSNNHEQLGIFVLILSILQPLGGVLRPKSNADRMKQFSKVHTLLGYFCVLFAMIDNLLGISAITTLAGGGTLLIGSLSIQSDFFGPLGIVVIILTALHSLIILYGFYRNQFLAPSSSASEIAEKLPQAQQLPQRKSFAAKMVQRLSQMAMPVVAPLIPKSELQNHASEQSCWVIYEDGVYDVTAFLNSHPGGKKALLKLAGKDVTQPFYDVGHSKQAKEILKKLHIGNLDLDAQARVQSKKRSIRIPAGNPNVFLSNNNGERKQVTLLEKRKVSPNVLLFKFGFPNQPNAVLGLPIGQHIAVFGYSPKPKISGFWNYQPEEDVNSNIFGQEIRRMYTPISNDEQDKGYFLLLVKIYRQTKDFPDGGHMTRFLENLQVGKQISIAGPFGTNVYLGRGKFETGFLGEISCKDCMMIAAGSGITPVYQILTAMLSNPIDATKIRLLCCNSTVDDILLKDKLLELEQAFPSRFKVWFTVSKPPAIGDWKYSVGRVSRPLLEQFLVPPSNDPVLISCGPQKFLNQVSTYLYEIGYGEDKRIVYEDAVRGKKKIVVAKQKPLPPPPPPAIYVTTAQQKKQQQQNLVVSAIPMEHFENMQAVPPTWAGGNKVSNNKHESIDNLI